MTSPYILNLSCPDRPGIVHAVSGFLFQRGGNILDAAQYADDKDEDATGLFFMNVPFHHIPVTAATKAAAEARQYEIMASEGAELVVLARYMQILSDDLCRKLSGRAINIHHSFLPSFKGARPYHQAHARGVKLIGATAHYVTSDLDEGPIIEQDVARVEHSRTVEDLTTLGRDTESLVLARAVKWHSERRVLLNGHKTVIFK